MFNDLTGQRFGKLTVLKRVENDGANKTRWLCQCDCGSPPKIIYGCHLSSGKITSCTCDKGKKIAQKRKKQAPRVIIDGDIGKFYINNNEVLFDVEDIDIVESCCWTLDCYGYLTGNYEFKNRDRLHRIIMKKYQNIEGYDIDHINGNTKDNRKVNLRLATRAENIQNSGLRKDNKSGCKGVTLTRNNTWVARITKDKIIYELGVHKKLEDAIAARKFAEDILFGEFSRKTEYLHNTIESKDSKTTK